MNTEELIAGMQLLLPHYKNSRGYHAWGEHNEIHMNATDTILTPSEIFKMIELGWHQEYEERNYDKVFSFEDYRPDGTWVAYT